MIDWTGYTNAQLLAVNAASLGADDLQAYREAMNQRGLSTATPPTVPVTPPTAVTQIPLVDPAGGNWRLSIDADGSLTVTNGSVVSVLVNIPAWIADGQLLVYDAASGRMLAGMLPGTKVVPGDVLTDDTGADLPMTAEDGVSWMQADTLPVWLTDDVTGETLTNEAGTLALTGG